MTLKNISELPVLSVLPHQKRSKMPKMGKTPKMAKHAKNAKTKIKLLPKANPEIPGQTPVLAPLLALRNSYRT